MVTRVSLSDWLAFQAGIRGFKNPRLLRDRPADGLHGWRKSAREWGMGYMLCMGSNSVDGGKGYEGLMAEGLPLVAKGPPLGRNGMGGEISYGYLRGGGIACKVMWIFAGIACRLWRGVTRVSLSDWLASQTRIRGSKDPRLLRDRPTDGAAWAARIHART